ncbi:hypothetical protein D5S17_02510 [Pseudonocardiaceae bacterium YIM PH 21723]|nr:hypothetical protein D5S17_02510 [Pseudonocardiaceae bacterium YIM PH 21723]
MVAIQQNYQVGQLGNGSGGLLPRALMALIKQQARKAEGEHRRRFETPDLLRPRLKGLSAGTVHYGLMISDLPAPHNVLSVMMMIGRAGVQAFDNDTWLPGGRRHSAFLTTHTSAEGAHHYRQYDARGECDFQEDGSSLKWGGDLTITGPYPHYRVTGRYDGWGYDLRLDVTDALTRFIEMPIYHHMGLLAPYTGTITHQGETVEVSGLGTWEYAYGFTPYQLVDLPGLALPWDTFSYQVAVAGDTMLSFGVIEAKGIRGAHGLYERSLDGVTRGYPDSDFTVLEYQDERQPNALGVPCRIPKTVHWQVRDESGEPILDWTGHVDQPFVPGFGQGFIGAYRAEGTYRGRPFNDNVYCEYINPSA